MKLIYPDTLIKNTLDNVKEDCCIVSPNSVLSILSPLFDSFSTKTQYDLNSLFNLEINGNNALEKNFELYDGKLKKDTKLFLKKDYLSRFENKFGCHFETYDDKDPQFCSAISEWVKEYTSDSNWALLNSSSINNILDFNFSWECFSTNQKSNKPIFFKEAGENVEIEFIYLESDCNYIDAIDLGAEILELPFSNGDFSIYFILPYDTLKISDIENRLNSCVLEEQISKMKPCSAEISIPKMKMTKMCDISNVFNQIEDENSKYKLQTHPNAYIGKILTKTYMEINEKGLKGCAASGLELIWSPIIKEMLFETNISNRYAKTVVTSKIENLENLPQEVSFTMILPQNAFVSEFLMIINGKSYKSFVQEKKEAQATFDDAVASGKSAALVAVSARDSDNFTVSVNIEPLTATTFVLTYEELLERRYDQYELVLNVHPGQIVDSLNFLLKIDESRTLKYVKTPALRSGNDISEHSEDPNLLAKIETSEAKATVIFNPDVEYQKKVALMFGNAKLSGFSGQFVVQYDVELDPSSGEVMISDGYFVHFYVPDDLPPMAKHIVFSLDTSGSMYGKLKQLQDAMKCILDQVRNDDLVDIVEFNSSVIVHNLETETATNIEYGEEENYQEPFYKYDGMNLPGPRPFNELIREKSKKVIGTMKAGGGTHAIGGLETALFLVKQCQEKYINYQSMIIFLTDGYPSEAVDDTNEITTIVTKLNHQNNKVPIFSLSFGEDADKGFLRRLSLKNFAFSRHIYEASDAALQLRQFYKQISSPLLSNVTFKYDSSVEDVTNVNFPIYFRGSDIVICGKYKDPSGPNDINLSCHKNCVPLRPTVKQTVMPLERLWAYLTIKQLLEQRENTEDATELTKKAVNLALKYSFVTEVTSLVVVKPDKAACIDLEEAPAAENEEFSENCSETGEVGKYEYGKVPESGCSIVEYLEEGVSEACSVGKPKKKIIKKRVIKKVKDGKAEKSEIFAILEPLEIEPTIEVMSARQFIANRPFLILIQAKLENQNVTLFVGRISSPVSEQ